MSQMWGRESASGYLIFCHHYFGGCLCSEQPYLKRQLVRQVVSRKKV